MLTKIICSQGFMYWVDMSSAIIEETVYASKDGKKYKLILRHPAFAVDGGEIDYMSLTDYMPKEELSKKYGGMLPVEATLNFNN